MPTQIKERFCYAKKVPYVVEARSAACIVRVVLKEYIIPNMAMLVFISQDAFRPNHKKSIYRYSICRSSMLRYIKL